jgi:xanthine dehydrogenase molybdopterin-binding subunit B
MALLHEAPAGRPGLVGQPVKRREDTRLLAGNGRFVDDMHLPGTLHLAFARSTQPHARLVRVDVSGELRPGVVLILTAEQVNGQVRALPLLWQFPGLRNAANPCMAEGQVRYVGEPVALEILRFARLLGRESIIAGTDCGLCTYASAPAWTPRWTGRRSRRWWRGPGWPRRVPVGWRRSCGLA